MFIEMFWWGMDKKKLLGSTHTDIRYTLEIQITT